MSLPWRLNKLARKKRGGPSDTEALFDAQKNGAVGGDAAVRRVETGRARLAQRGNRGRRKPFRHPRCRGMAEENEKIDGKKGAHAQTPALGASVGGEFKSFTCSREISSFNQQRQF